MQTLKEKFELLLLAKTAYYSTEESILEDDAYDALEEELIDAGYDINIGYEENESNLNSTNKVLHRVKMLSLQKEKVLDETMQIEMAKKIFNKYGKGLLSWKYDGLALESQYSNGRLVNLSTRGNGTLGRNVMDKFRFLVPETIEYLGNVDIRYEAVMSERVFEQKYKGQYKHSRNLVSGIFSDINLNDPRKFDIQLKAIEFINPDTSKLIHHSKVDKFFSTIMKEFFLCNSIEDLQNYFNQAIDLRKEFEFGVDGMVYTNLENENFEYKGKYPTYSIAIKFKPPRLISTITKITWKLSRTSKYCPVIWFTPIIVDGRTIRKASGYNFKYLLDNKLTIGKQIQVFLSNDIIPLIKKMD